MAYNQRLASSTSVPTEHLDYGYIEKCKKPSEVEEILEILRYIAS